jgi:hypothetical protein
MPAWKKSSRSGGEGGNCVELRHTPDAAVRDSKNPGTILPDPSRSLLAAVRAGHLGKQ